MRVGLPIILAVDAVLALGIPATAAAQDEDVQVRFNEAVELATTGYYDTAVETCLAVLEKLPETDRPRADKLLGYAYMKIEMYPESWHHLNAYLGATGKEDETARKWIEEVETVLRQTCVRITLECDVPGAVLKVPSSVDEYAQLFRRCPATLWLLPGEHEVLATAPGSDPMTFKLKVRAQGDKGSRKLRLAPAPPPPPVASLPAPSPAEPGPDSPPAAVAPESDPPEPSPEEVERAAEHRNYYRTEWASLSMTASTDGGGLSMAFFVFRWRYLVLELLRTHLGFTWRRTENVPDGSMGSLGAGIGIPIHFGSRGRFEIRLGLDLKAVAYHLTGDLKEKDWMKDADGLVGPGLGLRAMFVIHPAADRWAPSLQIGLEVLGIYGLYPGPDSLDWKITPGLSVGASF